MQRTETQAQEHSVYRQVFVRLSAACLFAVTAAAYATTDSTNDDYTDSVYSWGTWELGLEPASGPQAPSGKTMNDRSRSLNFRPNDNAAYMVLSIPIAPAGGPTPSVPTIPSAPAVPPPVPAGPPGFSIGSATTADPRN